MGKLLKKQQILGLNQGGGRDEQRIRRQHNAGRMLSMEVGDLSRIRYWRRPGYGQQGLSNPLMNDVSR